MQSLRSRLWMLIALLTIAGAAASGLMIGLFYQSASAQAGEAEAQIARACDSIASTYRFYSTNWQGPSTPLHDAALAGQGVVDIPGIPDIHHRIPVIPAVGTALCKSRARTMA